MGPEILPFCRGCQFKSSAVHTLSRRPYVILTTVEQQGDEQDLIIFGKNKFKLFLQNSKEGWMVGRKHCSVQKDDIVSCSSSLHGTEQL